MIVRRIAVLLAFVTASAGAQDSVPKGVSLRLLIEGGGTRPGIAVLAAKGDHGDSVRAILVRDLGNGDRVEVVGKEADDLPPVSGDPNLALFVKLGVRGIVIPTVTPDGLHLSLYDASGKTPTQIRGFALPGAALSGDWRMGVHSASDEIEAWATGVRGIAATRIAFVRGGKVWRIDSDGENAVPIEGTEGARSPAWDPAGRRVAIGLLPSAGGGIVVRDLAGGATRRLTPMTASGTYSAPVFSPDGATLIYSYGLDAADLYSVDLNTAGSAPKQITFAKGSQINTQPSFSPDGKRLVFMSDRSGHPEVYISDVDGTGAVPLTSGAFGDKQRTNPAWSPDNRLVAYQSMTDGQTQLMTVSPTGKSTGILTSDAQNEDPSWAPDGRHLVFTSTRDGSTQLWVLDTESARFRQLTRGPGGGKMAAWSSILSKP